MGRAKKRSFVKQVNASQVKGAAIRSLSLQYASGNPPPPNEKITARTPREIEAVHRRQCLIHGATASELRFRSILTALKIKHRFQEIVHVNDQQYYIMDFVIAKRKPRIIFEIDGGVHADQVDYDDQRTIRILKHKKYAGFRVVRFTNDQVLNGEAYREVGRLYFSHGETMPKPKRQAY
jgi:very-short-patch-repair endonuclease